MKDCWSYDVVRRFPKPDKPEDGFLAGAVVMILAILTTVSLA